MKHTIKNKISVDKSTGTNEKNTTVFARQISRPLTRDEQDKVAGGKTKCWNTYDGWIQTDYKCVEV